MKALGKPVTKSTSPFTVLKDFVKVEGIKGLYKGLDAAFTLQMF